MIYVGIDTGLHGAIAALDVATKRVRTCAVPVTKRRVGGTMRDRVDVDSLLLLARAIAALGPIRVAIETPTPRIRQGQASAIVSGTVYGLLVAAFTGAGCAVESVHPAAWKGRSLKGGKSVSVSKANDLFPADKAQWQLATRHDHAEAALIAHWISKRS